MSKKCIFIMPFILLLLVQGNSAFGFAAYCNDLPGGVCSAPGTCRSEFIVLPPPCTDPCFPARPCCPPGTGSPSDGVEGRQEDYRGGESEAGSTCNGKWVTPQNWADKHNTGVRPPDCYMFAALEPKPPDPCIDGTMNLGLGAGKISTSCLNVSPWRWTAGSGAPNFSLTIGKLNDAVNNANILIDAGQCIGINNLRSLGDTHTGYINMYGGTMFTSTEKLKYPYAESMIPPQTASMWLGGGSKKTEIAPGVVNMYGGLIVVPRVEIWCGYINLYGGTLKVTSSLPADLIINPEHSIDKINVAGGRLKLKNASDRIAEVEAYAAAGRILPFDNRGQSYLNIDVNVTYTDVNAAGDLGVAWNPSPADGAIEQPYLIELLAINGTPFVLRWSPGDWVNNVPEATRVGWGQSPADTNGHRVYLGTNSAAIAAATPATAPTVAATYLGAIDACNIDVNIALTKVFGSGWTFGGTAPGQLAFNHMYYWRVDEVNFGATVSGEANNAITPGSPWKGEVWSFKTTSGKCLNPSPADDSNYPFDINKPSLKWSPGSLACYPPTDSNGNRVYFGTDYDEVSEADTSTPIIYRGQVKSASRLKASYLLSSLGTDYDLIPDNTYYWRVDAVNDTDVCVVYPGYVWKFRFSHEYYVDAFDVRSMGVIPTGQPSWPWKIARAGNVLSQCRADASTQNGAALPLVTTPGLSWDSVAKTMIYDFNNDYVTTGHDGFAEARLDYPLGCDWTAGSIPAGAPKLLYVTFTGKAGNSIGPVYDRMYVMLEDIHGHQGKIAKLPDVTDQAAEQLRHFRMVLSTDLNSPNDIQVVDMDKIRYMRLGFGDRCNMATLEGPRGGSGTVTFDNIRLSQPICYERYGPAADFYDDCFVGGEDLGLFMDDWLLTGTQVDYPDAVPPAVAPVLWYDFNETDANGNLVDNAGSGGPAFDANVNTYVDGLNLVQRNASTWDAGGHIGRCINLVYGTKSFVNVPAAAIVPFADADGPNAVTFTCWIYMDPCAVLPVEEPGLINAADKSLAEEGGVKATELIKIECPTPKPPVKIVGPLAYFEMTQLLQTEIKRPGDFGGRWNHYAFVKDSDANIMAIYENGAPVKTLSTDIDRPLLLVVPKVLKIGARYGNNWGFWPGKIDDFRMYNYALNANEIAYLATDGTKTRFIPLAEPTNLKSSTPEIVNFPDYAEFANQWLSEQLWPQ